MKGRLGYINRSAWIFTSIEGCWQQNGINTQSQPEAVSKALKDTCRRDNKSPGLLFYSEICQVGSKHMSNWFMP